MPIINYASKEIQFKIVYYGPALSGKTTTIAYIHSRLPAAFRGDLVSLATAADRTLFFDFLPVDAVILQGFKTKFQLYTVPGQVVYNTTRQLVLRSVDGIVFVADSHWDKIHEDVESFRNLEENLRKQHLSLDEIPYVLQYNKRDLADAAPVPYLDFLLNNRRRRARSYEAIATKGRSVFAALDAVTQSVLNKFIQENHLLRPSPAREGVPVGGKAASAGWRESNQ